jgi:hypothetical protein
MVYRLGRLLQLLGLLLLPVAMAGNVMNDLDLRQMLGLAAVGILVFFFGWLLQQASRRN